MVEEVSRRLVRRSVAKADVRTLITEEVSRHDAKTERLRYESMIGQNLRITIQCINSPLPSGGGWGWAKKKPLEYREV